MVWPGNATFTDTDGKLLSDYTDDAGNTYTAVVRNLEITSEGRAMSNNSSSACEVIVNVTPPSADYEVGGEVYFKTVAGRIGWWVRRLPDEPSGYMLRFNAGNWQLLRWDDGTAVVLDEVAASVSEGNGYLTKIQADGSTIRGFLWNGTSWDEILSAVDATYDHVGFPGIYSHGNGAAPTENTRAHADNFFYQDIPSGGTDHEAGQDDNAGAVDLAVVTHLRHQVPDADVSIGGWTTNTGGTTNLFAAIDEFTPNDADYIQSSASPETPDVVEVGLTNIADPGVTTGHVVSYRIAKDAPGGDTMNLTVRLMQGATEIASWEHLDVSATPATIHQTLTEQEADAITNYSDLRLRFEAVVD